MARVSAFAAVPAAVYLLSATGVCKVAGLPLAAGVHALVGVSAAAGAHTVVR